MNTVTPDIRLSDSLVQRIKALQASMNRPDLMLRVAVLGGGCSGFQYQFSYVYGLESGDLVFEEDNAKLVVDSVSLDYINGSTVDYVDDLIGASFQIRNPNAQSSCGCGTSFSTF
jgi:iron-sulfur cluster insertion protein